MKSPAKLIREDPLYRLEILLEVLVREMGSWIYTLQNPIEEWEVRYYTEGAKSIIGDIRWDRKNIRKDVAKKIFEAMHKNLELGKSFKQKELQEVHESAVRTDIRLVECVLRKKDLQLRPKKGR